ncbi:MAG: TIGR00341 family protein [Planctomycetota bacterium]
MAERLIEILVPPEDHERALAILEEHEHDALWTHRSDEYAVIEILVGIDEVEPIVDELVDAFPGKDQLRVAVMKVESSIPSTEESEASKPEEPEPQRPLLLRWLDPATRISRDEIRAQLAQGAALDVTYLAMVLLSAVVAAIGLQRDNVAVIVGAMVIAPLLGPNMALAFATTTGDEELFARSARVSAVGVVAAFLFSYAVGWLAPVGGELQRELHSRTVVGLGDIALALASGAAGSLALVTGSGMSLVGVMVAVALLPPLVTFGMLLASGKGDAAAGAGVLLATNVICVNIASMTTFIVRGVRPKGWWRLERSARSTRVAMIVWLSLLAVVSVYIVRTQFADQLP